MTRVRARLVGGLVVAVLAAVLLPATRAGGPSGPRAVPPAAPVATGPLLTLLFRVRGDDGGVRAVALDLATGTQRVLVLPSTVRRVALDPRGSGVVTSTDPSGRDTGGELGTVAWDGTRGPDLGYASGDLLPGPDGTLVTLGWDLGHVVLRDLASGRVLRRTRTGGECVPVRWWNATYVLLTCDHGRRLLDPATGVTLRVP